MVIHIHVYPILDIIIPHVNSPYKTSIDERLIFYNITRCYSDGEYCHVFAIAAGRLVPHVDKAPLPLRILRLVTSNFLPGSRESHSSDCACSRKSICLHPGSISHIKMRNEHVLKTEKICRTFFSIRSLSNIAVLGNFDFNNFFNVVRF